MHDIAPEVVSIAEACLGGLQGRSALLIGPKERRCPFIALLQRSRMKSIYQEDTPVRVPLLLPQVELVISTPSMAEREADNWLSAASIAKGCEGRHSPLLIFDLAASSSVEELVGLLPPVCLYTPDDLRQILSRRREMKAS
ncbi:hypothetical protein EI42_03753 [Thermosporothrix hazakensis]|jgi:hypothetical protein|uniref:Uncharacterized protein n=2 Tax=Thermosporothrix TaxID=768650 RepID=A0A326U450_THEHA|nr:hypothetical protein [Thermosporothrix hazakensis]PZW26601.1 hypothetical protein EI42_03753 [Thermosporothrix hazakensis]BBH89516.1 hypothetical protein KTC_42670 [Thermosporothrix sp. COM3]GCE47698.1 hypothetical protein KTH_25670 [Thermosporothrix hazakensis]